MTDKDIIKALELCLANDIFEKSCSICKYKDDDISCMDKMFRDVLDLVNRQRAEIEEKSNKLREIMPIVAELKNEAVKEFAERLKANITINNTDDGYLIYSVDYNCLMDDIDDLLKEIVGEQK